MTRHTQTILWLLATNCLNVLDHFLGLALNGLRCSVSTWLRFVVSTLTSKKIEISLQLFQAAKKNINQFHRKIYILELHLKFEKKQSYKFCLHDLQKSIYNIWKAAGYIHLVNIYHPVLYWVRITFITFKDYLQYIIKMSNMVNLMLLHISRKLNISF